jgi:hypothetical protein
MQYKGVWLLGLSVAVLLGFSDALAQVNKNSIFLQARQAASELDIKLKEIQTRWLLAYVLSPTTEMRKQHPLITRSGVRVELSYSLLYGFLSQSEKERKQLVIDLLENLETQLFLYVTIDDKKSGRPLRSLNKRHIILNVIINDIKENDKKENIFRDLPAGFGVGQAGYKDGQFVYSETYFLKLQVVEGRAKSGDGTKFVIEREP